MTRMLIVDGMSVLKTTAGGMAYLTNGFAYNFFTQLTATIKKFPDIKGIIVCWEGGYAHRLKIYPEYKNTRKGTTTEIKQQRRYVQDMLELVGVDQAWAIDHEADDLGAWLVRNLNTEMILYTNDRDWLQLVRPGISVYQKSPFSEGKKNLRVEITAEKFEHYTGFPSPAEYLKAKCIMGDGDEIPGLEGIGEATVKGWLVNGPIAASRKKKIEEFIGTEEYARNMLLADLISPRDMDIQWRYGQPDSEKALELVQELKWNSIAAKFPEWWANYENARL